MNLQISAVLVVSSAHFNCVLMVITIDRKRHREREKHCEREKWERPCRTALFHDDVNHPSLQVALQSWSSEELKPNPTLNLK